MLDTSRRILIEFSGRYPLESEPKQERESQSSNVVSPNEKEQPSDAVDCRKIAVELEKRAGDVGRAIEKALNEVNPEFEFRVEVRFREGSLLWEGLVIFWQVADGLIITMALIEQIRRLVEFCVDRVVANESPIPSVRINGATVARVGADVAHSLDDARIGSTTTPDRWLRVLALISTACLLVAAGCLLIVALTAIGFNNI